ncbi:DUF2190 domain-containing protein [Ahniella affigens]|uniref:DUF2190 domain-containing protein n=1 Tax=Ahniella affigens TaxID=2021234 RepID=A0A2P1PST2_9GAMM|nr:DUF2190 family protein [Ahniella affigens]AVP97908.1 DUF2190 domain-containing protein [Ahniella affigens]
MSQSIPLLTLTRIAAGAILAERFVTHGSVQAGAAANTLGVARSIAATGEAFPVDVIGTTIVEAGAAFAAGVLLETNASGQAILRTAGPITGRSLQAASGAGSRVEILLIQN